MEPFGGGRPAGLGADERPPARSLRWTERGQPPASAAGAPGPAPRPLPAQRPQRREGVVCDLAGPHEIPQRVEHLPVGRPAGRREQLAVERGAAGGEVLADRDMTRLGRRLRRVEHADRSQDLAPGPDQGDPSVVAPEASSPHPGHLAERAQLVEQARLVARDPRRQDVALEDRGRDRQPGELVDHLGESFERGRGAQRRAGLAERRDTLPVGQEARERRRVHRLDLAPEPGQRPAAEQPQDLRIAPFAFGAARPELAAQDRAGGEQPLERIGDDAGRQPPAVRRIGRQERAVGPGVPRQQPVERAGRRPEERRRNADRRRDPDPVAVARHVLDGDPAVVARDPGPDGPAGGRELVEPRSGGRRATLGPCRDLGRRQVAQPAEQIVDAVERRCAAILGECLEAQLEIGQRVRVEQLAQLLLSEQLAQQVAVERQRAGPALGDRRVAVVHVGGHVVEHQAARERGGADRLDAVHGDLAPGDPAQDVAQTGQVEHVRQALPIGLDQDRERAVA